MDKNMQEVICQAHMAGQKLAGWKHPSWSEALAYFNTLEDVQERAPNSDYATAFDIIISEWCSKYNLSIDWLQRCNLRQRLYAATAPHSA